VNTNLENDNLSASGIYPRISSRQSKYVQSNDNSLPRQSHNSNL
jgi:hypothetical protein